VSTIAEVPYKKERDYVTDKINRGQKISRSNPFVYTLQNAAKVGVKSIQEFIKSVDLDAHLHS
jgi:hypothetical protein